MCQTMTITFKALVDLFLQNILPAYHRTMDDDCPNDISGVLLLQSIAISLNSYAIDRMNIAVLIMRYILDSGHYESKIESDRIRYAIDQLEDWINDDRLDKTGIMIVPESMDDDFIPSDSTLDFENIENELDQDNTIE